jgi:hypothetical protein
MLSRRLFNSGVLALASGPGCAALAPSNNPGDARHATLDLNNPSDLVRAVIKMRGSTDGSIRFGWLRAKRLSYIDGAVAPLYDLLAGTISQATANADGTFDVNVLETTYYVDSTTGELLRELKMPGTGRMVSVPLYRSGPKSVTVGSRTQTSEESTGEAGVVAKPGATSGGGFAPVGAVRLERSVGPAFTEGDTLWIRTEEYGRVSPANPKESAVFYRESATWQGRLTEIQNPDVHSAWTALSYSAASSWRPWMQMGDVAGHTMSNGIGGKVNDIRDMPAAWLRLTEIHHPDLLDDPAKALLG